jgi:hypothetical protein
MESHRDKRCREENQTKSQQNNGTVISFEVSPRCEKRARKKNWWQKHREHDGRIQYERWQTGQETQCQAAGDQKDFRRHPDASRPRDGYRRQEEKQ